MGPGRCGHERCGLNRLTSWAGRCVFAPCRPPGAVDRCADRAAAERRIDASDPLGAAADLEVAASLVEVAGDGGSVTSCGRIVFGACLVCLVLWAGTGLALTRESERR